MHLVVVYFVKNVTGNNDQNDQNDLVQYECVRIVSDSTLSLNRSLQMNPLHVNFSLYQDHVIHLINVVGTITAY